MIKSVKKRFSLPFLMLGLMWAIFFIDMILPLNINAWFGLHPRSLSGLLGIFTSPFLHGGLYHIISNSVPFLILSLLLCAHGQRIFIGVTLFVMSVGGILVWLFSQASVVGASGLVFGYWGFLITYGFTQKSVKSLIIAVVVLVLYGTLFISLFRYYPGVSWIGHFAGALAGFIAARYVFSKKLNSIH